MTDQIDDIPDLYEHEKETARRCLGALQRKWAFETNLAGDSVQQRFIREAKGTYAENGLVIACEFKMDVSDDPTDMNIYYVPEIKVVGRVDKVKQFDHDLQKHEVREGVFDGVKGVIDPNTGQMRDEPRKKIIT